MQTHLMWVKGIFNKATLMHIPLQEFIFISVMRASYSSVKAASPLHVLGRYCHWQCPLQGLPGKGGSNEGSLQPGETGHH